MNNNLNDKAINEWSAKECGVDVVITGSKLSVVTPLYGLVFWDFRHPVCMAVIRGYFEIDTHCMDKMWESDYTPLECQCVVHTGVAKTPHEADCACLVKIWEASHEQ